MEPVRWPIWRPLQGSALVTFDWTSILLPARRTVDEIENTPDLERDSLLPLLSQIREELCQDLKEADLPALFIWPYEGLTTRAQTVIPRRDIVIPDSSLRRYTFALRHSVEVAEETGVHPSGLSVSFHPQYPGGPDFQQLWSRSRTLSLDSRACDTIDSLWLGGIHSMIHPDTEWPKLGFQLLKQSGDRLWIELKDRGAATAIPILEALARAFQSPLAPESCGAPSRLAQDLILHRIARQVGVENLHAIVGRYLALRFRFFPSLEYRDWSGQAKLSYRLHRNLSRAFASLRTSLESW